MGHIKDVVDAVKDIETMTILDKATVPAVIDGVKGFLRHGGGVPQKVVWLPNEGPARCLEVIWNPLRGAERFQHYVGLYGVKP